MSSFAELFEQSKQSTPMRPGALFDATIIRVGSDYITVDAGLKSESDIPVDEFRTIDGDINVSAGDEIKVVLVQFDEFGQTVLSYKMAEQYAAWERLLQAHEASESVRGLVSGRVKGGFTVELDGGVRAFLPGSLVDVRPLRDSSHIENNTFEFKVIKLDRKRNNIVVSRRAVIEEENSAERSATLDGIEEGQVVKGVVKNLTDYGAFVDLGGIDGLLHKTDIAWSRVNHPNEVLNVGDEIEVIVLKLDRDKGRVSLGIKQLADNPWLGLAADHPQNTKLTGKVTNVTDYGCFVEIKDGVEGLVHQSEMDWTNKNVAPSKVVQVGDDVEVMVLEIDEERRRISLGIKQCMSNPWDAYTSEHEKGEVIKGSIKSITDFGVFIGLEGDIDGLVHLSDISWSQAGEVAIRDYKKGQEVEAVILAMDPERERISLGIKQMTQDAFGSYIDANPKGTIVKGIVTEVESKLVKLELAPDIVGQIKIAELAVQKLADASDAAKVGDEIEAKVMSVDRKNRAVTLSVRALEQDTEAELKREYSSKNESGTTLGDFMKDSITTDGEKNDEE